MKDHENERLKWDQYYASLPLFTEDEITKKFNQEFIDFISKILPSGGHILEAGCGGGWQSLAIAKSGKYQVTLIDFSEKALDYAKKLFTREKSIANFINEDIFAEGNRDYDLVFNAGVLEHYTFTEQVAFVNGMANRSKNFVLTLIPNLDCYWYWMWRIQKIGSGEWSFGKEIPQKDFSRVFTEAGINLIGQTYMGENWTENFIANINGIDDNLKDQLITIHRSSLIPLAQKGYLLTTLGTIKSKIPTIPINWQENQFERQSSAEIITSLAESLALNVSSLVQIKEKERQIIKLTEEIGPLRDDRARLVNIEKSRLWRTLSRIRLWIIPYGSLRESIYRRMLKKNAEKFNILQQQTALQEIINQNSDIKNVFVFVPSIEWNLHLFQRPQHMAQAFAKSGNLVFYCEPPYSSCAAGFRKLAERLYQCNVNMKIFKQLSRPNVIVFAYNQQWIRYFRNPKIIYEYIDDLSVFPYDEKKLEKSHNELLKTATIVVTSAKNLQENVSGFRPDAILCPNGVDYEHFISASQLTNPPPNDIVQLVNEGKPIIGYYGALAKWFDYDLLVQIANKRKDLNFLLIGPDYDHSILESELLSISNIHWLGVRDYVKLPDYLRYFDVAIIPFMLNKITHATSPLKLFEFMAAGKPVVITPMDESMRIGGVLVAGDVNEFSTMLDKALLLRNDPNYRKRINEIALENTWDKRAEQILEQCSIL